MIRGKTVRVKHSLLLVITLTILLFAITSQQSTDDQVDAQISSPLVNDSLLEALSSSEVSMPSSSINVESTAFQPEESTPPQPTHIPCPTNCSDCNFETGLCECPNLCSGHGTCNTSSGVCICEERHYSTDCSLKTCVDPSCNEVGTCDAKTGTCLCDSMHDGDRCELLLCANNCSYPNGVCDLSTGQCKCHPDWMGDTKTCSLNIHIQDLMAIKNWNTVLGTIWIIAISIGLPFFSAGTISGQLIMGLISLVQYIGFGNLMGSYVPPIFLKFCAFFEWSNFIFDLNVRTHQFKQKETIIHSAPIYSIMEESTKYYDIRQQLNENGLIVFLDNFILVCMVVILTLIFNGILIAYRMSKSQQRQRKLESNLMSSLIHLAFIAYLGVSSNVMYEIQLAFRGRVIVITLLVGFALLIGYIWGIPVLSVFALYQSKKTNTRNLHRSVLAPLSLPFKSEFYLFIAVVFVKNFLLGSLFGLFTSSPKDQCIGILIVLSSYLLIVMVTKPYAFKLRTAFEVAMTVAQILTMITVLLFSVRAVTNRSLKNLLCILFIILPHSFLILAVISYLTYRLYVRIREGPDARVRIPYQHKLFDEDELHDIGNQSILETEDSDNEEPTTSISPVERKPRKKVDLFNIEPDSDENDDDQAHLLTF